jgi:hypothetical protein
MALRDFRGLVGRAAAALALVAAAAGFSSTGARAQLLSGDGRNSIFVFGGLYTAENFGMSFPFLVPKYESGKVVGAAFSRRFYDLPWGFTLSGEVGLAARFNAGNSAEIWAGPALHTPWIALPGGVNLRAGMIIGMSFVTQTTGIERQREILFGGNGQMLAYLGPEASIGFDALPNLEFTWRLHHRSGAYGTFGDRHEGANANVFGVKFHF